MKKKTIFLDRDGVVINNEHHYYIWKPEQVQYVDGIFENLQILAKKGFQFFIVSNQGGISRGFYTKTDVQKLHLELAETLRKYKVEIADIAFCPHHPDVEKCLCRKPESLLLEKLIAKYSVSKKDSYFVGDSETDLEAARKAGISGIKVRPNRNMYENLSLIIE